MPDYFAVRVLNLPPAPATVSGPAAMFDLPKVPKRFLRPFNIPNPRFTLVAAIVQDEKDSNVRFLTPLAAWLTLHTRNYTGTAREGP